MVFTIILLAIILAVVVTYVVLARLGKLETIFGSSIVKKAEKKRKVENYVEVLKKEQKVAVEEAIKACNVKKTEIVDSVNAQVAALQARIAALKEQKASQCNILDEKLKVDLDRIINDFDQKITTQQNVVKKLGYFINAEQKNIADVVDPAQPNAPTEKKVLVEKDTKKNSKN